MKVRKTRNAAKLALVVVLAVVAMGCNKIRGVERSAGTPLDNFESTTPESAGVQSEKLEEMLEYIDANDIEVHSIIIWRNGTIPFEMYFGDYNRNVSHNLKSTSKGVISALIGVAVDRGMIDLDDRVTDYFPEYQLSDPRKSQITVKHLLTMTAGLKWNENDLNSMYTFFVSGNIARRVLNLPVVEDPGAEFNYSTASTHLLSAILSRATGMSTLEFADQYLFEPLGIENVMWETDRAGDYVGGSELFLTPRAMAAFGILYLNGGQFNGRQIIPRKWVEVSTSPQIEGVFHGAAVEYGYLWWLRIDNPLFEYIDDDDSYLALGVHGQRILIDQDQNAVVVITANEAEEMKCDLLLRDFIVPAITD